MSDLNRSIATALGYRVVHDPATEVSEERWYLLGPYGNRISIYESATEDHMWDWQTPNWSGDLTRGMELFWELPNPRIDKDCVSWDDPKMLDNDLRDTVHFHRFKPVEVSEAICKAFLRYKGIVK